MNFTAKKTLVSAALLSALIASVSLQAATPPPLPTPGTGGTVPLPPPPGLINTPIPLPSGSGNAPPLPAPGKPTPVPQMVKDTSVGTPVPVDKNETFPKEVKELIKRDRVIGVGESVQTGQPVTVHYTGWVYDPSKPDGKGNKFDSSVERIIPFGFFIGVGKVIKGWDQGVPGMKVKGKRTLIIPADMAYGSREIPGKIPANSPLIFDIELMEILAPAAKAVAPGAVPQAAPAAPTTPSISTQPQNNG